MKCFFSSFAFIVAFSGVFVWLSYAPQPDPVNIAVYGSSATGYSWIRTYSGPDEHTGAFITDLRDSYLRLAQSMDAGSSLKLFHRGTLVAQYEHKGNPVTPFSGVQITVHDEFARQNAFETIDMIPYNLADMDAPQEPFRCGGQQ